MIHERRKFGVFPLNQAQQDFITYTPEVIRYVSEIELSLLSDYQKIVTALKNKYLTVKEIYQLYYDKNLNKHTCTLKTVYKHMEKLEAHNLVVVAGHRRTQGRRVTEKLYSRTAHLFYPKYITEPTKAERLKFLNEAKGVQLLLSHLLGAEIAAFNEFKEFYSTFKKEKFSILLEILHSLSDNSAIAEFLSSVEVEDVNTVNDLVTTLAFFLRNPEKVKKLQTIFR